MTQKPSSASVSWIRSLPWFYIPGLILLLATTAIYWKLTQLPGHVVIASGPSHGRYSQLAKGLAEELERRLGIDVEVRETKGSMENLLLLETHQAHIALYQPGSRSVLGDGEISAGGEEPAKFVSNLYPEYLIPVQAASKPLQHFATEPPQTWACSDLQSGDHAMARLLMNHLGLTEQQVSVISVPYAQLPKALQRPALDYGILCCGLHAPILKTLVESDCARMVEIPALSAMVQRNALLEHETIPTGFFQVSPPVPSTDFRTVSVQAQLLADTDAPVRLVEEVTRIIMDAGFQRQQNLNRLFASGRQYAMNRPEYGIHDGASHVYNPGLKPLLNPDFVEGTEGLRSFIVSLLAAAWLLRRWWIRRQVRSQEHRLDRYIRELLALERAQMEVDGEGGAEESSTLQSLLDKVTILRQEALSEFTAHELNEDRAADCFIEMCHALSDKINAKLTRHTILAAQKISPS